MSLNLGRGDADGLDVSQISPPVRIILDRRHRVPRRLVHGPAPEGARRSSRRADAARHHHARRRRTPQTGLGKAVDAAKTAAGADDDGRAATATPALAPATTSGADVKADRAPRPSRPTGWPRCPRTSPPR